MANMLHTYMTCLYVYPIVARIRVALYAKFIILILSLCANLQSAIYIHMHRGTGQYHVSCRAIPYTHHMPSQKTFTTDTIFTLMSAVCIQE